MPDASEVFCWPCEPLENDRLRLEPFQLSEHATPFVQGCQEHPTLFDYLPYGPFSTVNEFESWYTDRIQPSATETLYAILAKSSPPGGHGTLAGVVGLLNASPGNASVEMGFVCSSRCQRHVLLVNTDQITVLPLFQRTFVASNAIGLLLLYTLDGPPSGLGLRRVQWQSHAANDRSIRAAERIGFTLEGIQRFQRILPSNKRGNGFDVSTLPGLNGRKLGPSRDSAVLAMYCDEWPEKRKDVMKRMGSG